MKELMDQLMTYIRGIWRYRWYAMILAWALVLAGWLVVAKLPDQYQATARIFVDTDSILRPLMRGLAVQTDLDQRVQIMTRTLLSRPNLEKVTRMTDLDITARTPEDLDRLVQRLGDNIELKSAGRRRENLYEISYSNSDPQQAKRVVQALLTIFVESTLGQSRQDSDAAQKFLDQQLREYEARLVESEERLKEFKRKHVGMMPGDDKDYFVRLQDAESALSQAKLELQEESRRRDEIRGQISGEEPVFGFGGPGGAGTPATELDERISKLQEALDNLKLRYTDQHPDVISAQETLAELEAQREEELAAMGDQGVGMASPLNANPVYQQMKIALAESEGKIASLSVRVQEYEKRVAALREMIDTIPEVETELKRLNRDYAVTKQNYEALLARRESAQLAEDVEQTGDDVKFRVVDPPHVPANPSGPNRLLLSTGVLFGGLAAGVILALLLSQLWPAIYDRRALRDITGFPVFGAVSRIWTRELLRKRRLEVMGFATAGLTLLAVYSLIMWLHSSDQFRQLLDVARRWV